MPVKVIAYLVIGVFSILIAIAIFVKLWNTFIGQDTVNADVKGLANLINEMLEDNREYIQQPYILQLQDKTIIGFDERTDTLSREIVIVDYSRSDTLRETKKTVTINKPNECKGETCICTAEEEKLGQCYPVKAATNVVTFAMHAPGIETAQPVKKTVYFPSSTPPDIADNEYYELWFDKNAFTAIKNNQGKLAPALRSKAIIPLLIEKVKDPNSPNTWIIVSLDVNGERSRYFYLETCGEKSDEKCRGKTAYESFREYNPQFCSSTKTFRANVLEEDKPCVLTTLPTCQNGVEITAPCSCNGLVSLYGFCLNNEQYFGSCDEVKTCEDYCKQDASDDCSLNEQRLCAAKDPCSASSGKLCRLSDQKTKCVVNDAQQNSILSEIDSTIAELLKSTNAYSAKQIDIPIGSKILVGFDQLNTNTIRGYNPTLCQSYPCLCLYEKEGETDPEFCMHVNEPTGTQLIFGSDSNLEQKITSKASLGVLAGNTEPLATSQLVLSQKFTDFTPGGTTGTSGTSDQTVLNLVIEKYVHDTTAYVTILPFSARTQNRFLYFLTCGMQSTAECAGKTPFTSYDSATKQYCLPKNQDTCIEVPAGPCPLGEVTGPCLCGERFVTDGYCANNVYTQYSCSFVTSCANYCETEQTDSSGVVWKGCTEKSYSLCQQDPCNVGDCRPLTGQNQNAQLVEQTCVG